MNSLSFRALLPVFFLAWGCGYNPKASTPPKPDAGVDTVSSQGSVDAWAPDLQPDRHQDTTLAPPDATGRSDGGAAGASGNGGTTAVSSGGGAVSSGGATVPGTTSPAGGSTGGPDAAPDLPVDVPANVSCAMPTAPAHGSVSAPTLTVGSQASYKCETGYGASATSRTCQADGTWSGAEPVCNLADCGPPPAVSNSKVEAPSTAYNSTAKYTCDPGYATSAATTITCQSDARWTSVLFACNPVDCKAAPALEHADVSAPLTTFGSVATYYCQTGFALLSATENKRTCQADGTWSLPAPSCKEVDCGAPPTVANGSIVAPDTTFGGTATYTCSVGFSLVGPSLRTCQADGAWSGAAPSCPAITPKLTVIKGGSGKGSIANAPSTNIACGTTCEATFSYNASVILSATPDAGQSFVGWDHVACPGKGTCTLKLTVDTTVTAIFSPPPNIVFVTSTEHTANLGGLAGADAICAARATAAGLAGTYKAWLSTSTVSAKSRLGTASGWVRPDGKPVLSLISDIEKDKFFYPPALDEAGVNLGLASVRTCTDERGLLPSDPAITTCGDWTSDVDVESKYHYLGFSSSGSRNFTANSIANCAFSGRLYCFGIDRTAFVAPDPISTGRKAFTTSAYWKSGAGLSAADALCQAEASEAGLTGTFKALLAATGASAASRFAGNDTPWYRMDGLALAASAHEFFAGPTIAIPPTLTAKGERVIGRAWAGATSMVADGTDDRNCSNWTSSSAAAMPSLSEFDNTAASFFFGLTTPLKCSGDAHLVCLQN